MINRTSGLQVGLLAGVALLAGCAKDVAMPLPSKFQAVAAGLVHSCGILQDGAAFCWGNNNFGQLGDGSRSSRSFPVAVVGSVKFSRVSPGGGHTCGLATSGAAYCWGFNLSGQLGDRTHTDRTTAAEVDGGRSYFAISAGGSYSCGIATDSTAYCWGYNGSGALGNGTTSDSPVPVAVTGGLKFRAISAGPYHTCGLTSAGAAYCLGANQFGELGTGGTDTTKAPFAVKGCLTFTAILAGYNHSCGVAPDGNGYCWGRNQFGQLGGGDAIAGQNQLVPYKVGGGIAWGFISSGAYFTCGVGSSRSAFCWGYNGWGQLGASVQGTCATDNGSVQCALAPTAVGGGLTFTMVSAATQHVCGLSVEGTAYCWGLDSDGQLGDGRTGSNTFSVDPVKVGGQP
jgi:alpha-tubulin suppressor-like RCC1 family protein